MSTPNGSERGKLATLLLRGRQIYLMVVLQHTDRFPSVSVGCGLPVMIQMHDWSLTTVPDSVSSSVVDMSLGLHLRIEQFRHRVSQVLGSSDPNPVAAASRERLSLYQLLNTSLNELENDILGSPGTFHLFFSSL